MTRFFGLFAIVCTGFLLAAVGLGYFNGALGLSPFHHLLLGLTAAILSISLHCLVFGIFTGAGKDTRELVQDLSMDPQYTLKTKSFRKVVFPPAMYSILLLLVSALFGGALGAAPDSQWLRWTHAILMWFAVYYNVRSFLVEYRTVKENAEILARLNVEAGVISSALPALVLSPDEPALLATATEKLEWGTHVYALGKFLCFVGFNVWLPYIYLRFIVGYFTMPVWPFLSSFLLLIGSGYYLRARYRTFRPDVLRPLDPAKA